MWPESRPAATCGMSRVARREGRTGMVPGMVTGCPSAYAIDRRRCSSARISVPRRAPRGPARRCGACRGSTSNRSSSAADQRTSPVWPPRPDLRLLSGSLHGDDHVTQVEPRPGRPRLLVPRRPRRERIGRQQRERQHVRRAGLAHMGRVEPGELSIVREDQPDRGRGRRLHGIQRRGHRPRQGGESDGRRDPVPHVDVDPPGRTVDTPRHDATVARAERAGWTQTSS